MKLCVVSTLPSSPLGRFPCTGPFLQPVPCRTIFSSYAASRRYCRPIQGHHRGSSCSPPTPAPRVLELACLQSPKTCGGRSTILTKNRGNMCDSAGAPRRLRWKSARHNSRRLVCALRLPVPWVRSHQRTRVHCPDVARKALGQPWSAQTENPMLCDQSRRPRSGLKRPLLVKTSQLRASTTCIRVSQCVPVNRLVV